MPSNRKYAAKTDVPVAQSKAEIEELFVRFGIENYFSGFQKHGQVFAAAFTIGSRNISMSVTLDQEPKEQMRQMRALYMVIKAKLVAVEEGLTTAEDEFLAHTMTRDGRTISQVISEIERTGKVSGEMLMLPAPKGEDE